jgi:hypothetical protein
MASWSLHRYPCGAEPSHRPGVLGHAIRAQSFAISEPAFLSCHTEVDNEYSIRPFSEVRSDGP